ncbi:MAG: T9SS type A sorting domain-containing protein [Bacteroidales bacterium]|nr:T9SS type A sorting domain-containing protein [Bacteroidales bacterium]
MRIKISIFFVLLAMASSSFAQVYDNYPNAIHKDNPSIIAWAKSCEVHRGYINIADTSQTFTSGGITSNRAFAGSPENACGKADGLSTVSLGDGGYAIVQFDKAIRDGEGFDFVVFENAFFVPPNSTETAFLELAFVEVSSDGENYFRFPCLSEMPYINQVGSFEETDWTKYHGFAGIFTHPYGVAFDLNDIEDNELLDKQNITHIKIIDVVGCIQAEFASYDSHGNIINEPWPTPFHTGGFDLDALGVINNTTNSIDDIYTSKISLFPNPASNLVKIQSNQKPKKVKLFDLMGNMLLEISDSDGFNIENLKSGIYIIKIYFDDNQIISKKLIRD